MKTSRPGPDLQNNNLHIPILDRDALKKLSTEPNSSKFAIDAHNRAINEIRDLSEFPKLCSLDVSFNRLTSLKNIHTGKELRELKAYNNKLSSLRFLKGNGNLEGLLVQENQVDEIAEDLHALVKLKTLWLNGNRLSRVQNLGACRLLVHLDVSRNRLTGVAAEGLDNLHSLEYLNLSGNKISALGNLTHLTKLEELNLSSNRISTLEGGLLPANLTVLRLNDNQLASLQSFPPYLTKLNELYLQDNAIVEIGESAAKFPQLESLDLRNNRIRSVAQLQIGLTGCSTLVDLWIHGNPCCLSQTYLLEIVQALPELRTLESMTDTQLKAQMEALKNGVITQDALLASMARPMTPQSSRPGSASSYRPMTPTSAGSSRPATPERSVPVIHHSSTRSGALLKIASPQELEKAQADVAERLQAMKAMLGRISKGDMPKREPRSTQRTTESKARHENSFRKPVASGPETLDNQVSEPSQDQIRKTRTLHSQRTSSRGVDAGTDPLDSLMGNRPLSSSSARSPEIITPRRAMETQTPRDPVVALPPAPVAMATSLSKTHFVDAAANTTDNQSKEEINGDAIEWEMKQQLLAFVTPQPEDPDNADGFGESPRIENHKSAEQRVPPNSHSRQGYRTFRIPSRLRHHDPETAQTPANAVQ